MIYASLLSAQVLGLDPCGFRLDLHVYLHQPVVYFWLLYLLVFSDIGVGEEGLLLEGKSQTLALFVDGSFFLSKLLDLSFILEFQILAHHHQVEPDLFFAVFLDPLLDFLFRQVHPILLLFVLSNEDGAWLQTVKLVKIPLVRDIAYKVVNICFFLFFALVLLEDKWLRTTKTVMKPPDCLGIAKR